MTLPDYIPVIRRWRLVIVAAVLIGVLIGWVSAPGGATPVTFEATHTLLLDPSAQDPTLINRAAVLATLGAVPDRVAARLQLDPRLVRSMVSAGTRDAVGQLLITGRSSDPQQAEALADVTAEEVVVGSGGAGSALRTLERAKAARVAAGEVFGPRSGVGRGVLLGAFGLLLGIAAAFAIERFDTRIRSSRSAEGALGRPVLAEVPPFPTSPEGRLLDASHPPELVESFRRIATYVDRTASGPGSGDRRGGVFVVTSADAGEGKTTTVAHLAAAMGELGRSVLAVSADLRRPRLHLFFDRRECPGLADVLRGDIGLGTLDLETPVRGVRLLASGAALDNPAPLLEHADRVVDAVRSLADVVLVDTPPLAVSDTAELMRHADGALLVVRAGRTSTGAARRSAELLERLGIPLVGAVLLAAD